MTVSIARKAREIDGGNLQAQEQETLELFNLFPSIITNQNTIY